MQLENQCPASAFFSFSQDVCCFSKASLSFCQQLGRLPFPPHHTKQAIAPSKRLKSWMRDSTCPQKRLQLSPQGFHTNPDMTGTRSCFIVASHWRSTLTLCETFRTTDMQIYKTSVLLIHLSLRFFLTWANLKYVIHKIDSTLCIVVLNYQTVNNSTVCQWWSVTRSF